MITLNNHTSSDFHPAVCTSLRGWRLTPLRLITMVLVMGARATRRPLVQVQLQRQGPMVPRGPLELRPLTA